MVASTSNQVRQRVPAAERRDALIAAAIEEFALGGLHGTPVDRIARRVGVAQPYVFSLFPTKRDLFIAAVERGFERVMALFTEKAEEFKLAHPEGYERKDLLRWIGDSYIQLLAIDRSKLMFQLQAYAACSDETIRERVGAAYARLERHVSEITDAATEDEVNEFLSHGMWLNVQAALGRPDLEAACEWLRRRSDADVPAEQ